MPSKKDSGRYQGVERRVQWLSLALVLAMALLCVRFWSLQIVSLGEFTKLAENNRVWQKRLAADRGMIYDSKGEVLADNRASADVVFVPGDCPAELLEKVCHSLEALIGSDPEELLKRVSAQRHTPFTQLLVKRDISKVDRVRVEENLHALPGVATIVHPQRRYLFQETAGQLLGYLGEINRAELDRMADQGYFMGDLVGKDGLERYYEDLLHGRDGFMLVTRYASGQPQLRTDRSGRPVIARRDSIGHHLNLEAPPVLPHSGGSLHLTLDIDLQRRCEAILKDKVGAIVILDADTGAVLAMASEPGYDPGVFVNRGSVAERMELLSGAKPNRMSNRGFREVYPPGSIFKIVLAAAALEENLINNHSHFFCPGHYTLDGKGRRWHCWQRYGHGNMTVAEALAYSCDVFFYNVGRRLDVDRIVSYSHKMGVGVKTGIDLPGEMEGLVPGREWKAALNADKPVWEQQWYPGETINLSIGQGSCTATVLQGAVMMACIVNGGYRVRPFLNKDLGEARSEKLFRDDTIEEVTKGLRQCIEKKAPPPTGTGKAAAIPGLDIIGKTGTAQVVSLSSLEYYRTEADIPYEKRHHAWFVCGVLNKSPRISVAVLIEHGHSGGAAAAPVAREVIETFYDIPTEEPLQLVSDRR
ncbi:MAG: penicillin-binding protein 2 [Candidatus Hydrogenedentales bacterium]|jgi:penicillin-binding protein 2